MSYTVIARRWRPQKLDEVVGQRAVTQTLRNAVASGRIAQAFVFAGPRGVGKTTTARILARMLNCDTGPTPDPCGACDACREIADGRDMDVLEIDAASNTGIDNVREVIISGLAILPARDRYKVFIIDEVHQLSGASFNALLKSIEEPPPHVAFIMATTAPDKIPETILSRSQVFEFKTISSAAIAEQLTKIAKADGIGASPEAIALVARSAEGSMRDAETALDQVIAFAGTTVTAEDVATVLGLVGRDLLFDVLTAVADENGAAAFELAGRAVEAGYDLRCSAANCRASCATCWYCRSTRRASATRRSPSMRTASASRRFCRGSRARTSCGRSTCSRAPRARSAAPRSRATPSRWRCCAGFICASSRRSRISSIGSSAAARSREIPARGLRPARARCRSVRRARPPRHPRPWRASSRRRPNARLHPSFRAARPFRPSRPLPLARHRGQRPGQ